MADDRMAADVAYRLASEGTALLWRGDFQNARHLLQALSRRVDRRQNRPGARPGGARPGAAAAAASAPAQASAAFHAHRLAQAQRARLLSAVLVPFEADYVVPLRRAPDVRQACRQAWGPEDLGAGALVASLRELLGVVSACEWRKNGVLVPVLGPHARIHPHHGVFSPVRGEYLQLVADAPWPAMGASGSGAPSLAIDVGTGTGVLAALLAQRGAQRVLATDLDARALACAADNLARLGLTDRVSLVQADLFPAGEPVLAAVVVCNPPWVPARAGAAIERAVYDEDSRMLRGFLATVAQHLLPGGQAWLVLSDLAERLGLRSREQLLGWVRAGGLQVVARDDTRPVHPKAHDASDPLHAARAGEVTSLWRLAAL